VGRPEELRPALIARVRRALLGTLVVGSIAAPALLRAQQSTTAPRSDTARITYRTEDLVFVAAGRTSGLAVGDTLELLANDQSVLGHAVVLSVAQQTASARLLGPAVRVAVGQLARFVPHPPSAVVEAPTPPPDTAIASAAPPAESAAAAVVAAPVDTGPPPPVRPIRAGPYSRWRGNFQLDQSANSAGGQQSLTTYQTSGSVALSGPLTSWLSFASRATTRFRNGTPELSALGLTGSSTILYQLEARVAPPGGWWNLSLGRFLPADAPGMGYLDGARVEVQPAGGQRIGVLAGYAPDVFTMEPSTQVARAGAYWGFTGQSVSGSLSGATEWQWSQIRRTWFSAQSFWSPSPGTSFSLLTDVDHGAGWESFRGFRLTDLSVAANTTLPLGFRGGLAYQTQEPLELFSMLVAGDTFPLPGRLTELTATLGHGLGASSLELTAGYLKRTTDPNPTWRGTLMFFSRHIMVAAMAQHGDLFDFGSLVTRIPIPLGNSPVTAALGFASNVVRTPGGGQTLWRYGVQPELGYRLGGGFYFSMSGDIGQYAGLTSTYLRAGVSYQLW